MPFEIYLQHQEECGNRTERCKNCKRYIIIRNFPAHIGLECEAVEIVDINSNNSESDEEILPNRKRVKTRSSSRLEKRLKRE